MTMGGFSFSSLGDASIVDEMRATSEDLQSFVEHCQKKVPNFAIHDGKKNSYLMNVIDGLIWPFNPKFLERYITTIAGKVYFPDGFVDRNPTGAVEIGSHEFIHAYDVKRLTFPLFMLLYLAPQLLVLVTLGLQGSFIHWAGFLPFAALLVHLIAVKISFKARRVTGFPLLILSILVSLGLSVFFARLEALWLLVAVVPLLPIPSPGRYWAEMRGYGMTVHMDVWLTKRVSIASITKQFTTAAYYWMWPFAEKVKEKLLLHEVNARAGKVTDPAYLHVWEFIKRLKER